VWLTFRVPLEEVFVVSELASLLPLVAIALLFWVLLIRPQQRRSRAMRQMQSSLSVGDEVILTSGILGTVRAVVDDHVEVEVATGVTLRVVRGAIGSVVQNRELSEPDERSESVGNDPTETPEER